MRRDTRTSEEKLEAYLDGLLSPDERRIFEAELERDPELSQPVERQRAIDDSLRSLFPAPSLSDLHARVHSASLAAVGGSSNFGFHSRFSALAAAFVAYLAAGLWLFGSGPAESLNDPELSGIQPVPDSPVDPSLIVACGIPGDWGSGYAELAESCGGSWSRFACSSFEDVLQESRRRLGHGISVRSDTQVAFLGSRPAAAFGDALVLVGRFEDRVLVVCVLPASSDPHPTTDPAGGLSIFRRELGPLILYEITPLDQPHLLDLIQRAY